MCACAKNLENLIRCVLLALCTSCGFHQCDLRGYFTLENNRVGTLKMPEASVPSKAWQIETYTFCGSILGLSWYFPCLTSPHTHILPGFPISQTTLHFFTT